MTAMTNISKQAEAEAPTPIFSGMSLTALGVLALVVIGDLLLWDGWFGLSWALYLLIIMTVQIALHIRSTPLKTIAVGAIIALVSVAPVFEYLNALSALLSTFGVFSGCLVIGNCFSKTRGLWLSNLISRALAAPARFPKMVSKYFRSGNISSSLTGIGVWIAPIALALVFVLLFTEANPVWQSWWNAIEFSKIIELIFNPRWFFWVVLTWFSLPFLSSRLPRPFNVRHLLTWESPSYGPGAINTDLIEEKVGILFFIRCLILFNFVFAVQTLLDLQFLWGRASLPDGMTYAQYAHRGAYPLIVAALLAAFFVLIATRPGGAGEKSNLVKWLVIGWVAQNLILVFSSVERLNLYVAAYAMTYWRIAAFIWMGLVAIGLLLIVMRFVTGKSCHWLLVTNLASLVLVLYVTSFVNMPNFIASYNLKHSKIYSANGSNIDWGYISILGPDAYLAVVKFNTSHAGAFADYVTRKKLVRFQKNWGRYYSSFPNRDWRNWSFREQRAYWLWERFGNQPEFGLTGERAVP